ncbi:MAG TPA: glycoside hydrolase family 43 protein [Candidatus Binatia bacterium]|nr:glycoside hydrolase family 43 protein [Candidatus Binatia bacterium]
MNSLLHFCLTLTVLCFTQVSRAQTQAAPASEPAHSVKLADVRLRDCCVWADTNSQTYYLVSSTGHRGPHGRPAVIEYTSKDLETWNGPEVIFEVPPDFWANRGIWAPELHAYKGKFYLFLTFNTDHLLPEQWRNWEPRVQRGSQILVGDSPHGPFKMFANHATLPSDMMTLDGTFWVEDGVPYMVFSHEWVQITDGRMEYIRLKDDLSGTVGEPEWMFQASDAPWSQKSAQTGCHVTDGPYLYRSKTGKLMMVWSSFGAGGYEVGLAISKSGKLAGPWVQQAEPLYDKDGGHPMLFHRFDGQLMMILHSPNHPPMERAKLFAVEDLGDTLRLKQP